MLRFRRSGLWVVRVRSLFVGEENYGSLAETLKSELDLQLMQIDTLKKNFISIQGKIRDDTTIQDYFIKLPPLESGVDSELATLKAKIMESCSTEN